MKLFSCLAGVTLCGLLLGCATTSSDKSGGPTKRDVNKVLSEYRRAETALRANRFAEAKSLLDDAILTISGVPAKDPDARRARGLFHAESGKTYFGEPYERVDVEPGGVVVIHQGTPLQPRNETGEEILFLAYGAPTEHGNAEFLEDVESV